MNDLKVFNYGKNEIRTAEINGMPYFIGNDVARTLGYSNVRSAVPTHVEKEDRLCMQIKDAGQTRNMTAINESGLYSLVLSSKLPDAKKFKRWVTSEVLPSIRKNGAYMTDETIEKALTNPDFLIQLATNLKSEKEKTAKLSTTVKVQEQLIGELKPKADYTDKILQNKGLVSITQIAKDYGMSGMALNKILHSKGIQYKQASQWLLYSKYQAQGYTHSKTIDITRADGRKDVVMETKWTQKGRLFLYDLLKSDEILPLIERTDKN